MSNESVEVFVDADACPAREEILLVCKRHSIVPVFVANKEIPAVTNSSSAKMEIVAGDFALARGHVRIAVSLVAGTLYPAAAFSWLAPI